MKKDWASVLSEPELIEKYGLTPRQLSDLRKAGLPYIGVNRETRLYAEEETIGFFGTLVRVLRTG